MKGLEPIPRLYATLERGEKHLNSFAGQACEWIESRGLLGFGKTKGYYPQATGAVWYYRGHLTNRRLILEIPPRSRSEVFFMHLLQIGGVLSGSKVGDFIGHMGGQAAATFAEVQHAAATIRFFSLSFKNITKVICLRQTFIWAVLDGSRTARGIPFIPRDIDQKGKAHERAGFFNAANPEVSEFCTFVSKRCKVEKSDGWDLWQ